MGQLTPPATVADFKNLFSRDFIYGTGLETVRDLDIQNALNMASTMFNPCLFSTALVGIVPNQTSEALMAYLNVSAHCMVTSLQAVGGLNKKGGGAFSQGEGVITGKGVGGVSINFQWPAAITDSAALFQFVKTTYGQAYLQVLMTKLVGNISAVAGEMTEGFDNPII